MVQNTLNPKRVVDLTRIPILPEGDGFWVAEHSFKPAQAEVENVGGKLYLGGNQVVLKLQEEQLGGRGLYGHELWKRFRVPQTRVLNVSMLGFLLEPENRSLIPEDWEGKNVWFLGTTYCGRWDHAHFLCLHFKGPTYFWFRKGLSCIWTVRDPVAMLNDQP